MMVRPPAEIYMHDDNSCASCVTLQVLYMFGFENPPLDLTKIDRRIGRSKGATDTGSAYLELMRYPLAFIGIDAIDYDAVLKPDGYSYTRSYFLENDPQLARRFTFQRFLEWQETIRAYHARLEALPCQRESIVGMPSGASIQYLLQERGCPVVIASTKTRRASHMILAFETTWSSTIRFYIPDFPGGGIFEEATLSEIDDTITRSNPLLGITWP